MLLLLSLFACQSDPTAEPIAPYDPLPLVDVFIGTGGVGAGIGAINPGAALPFGMTIAGPDTRSESGAPGFYHCGGYYHPDTRIEAFAHTHAHGMGVPDFGGVAIMPRVGWSDDWTEDKTRSAPFSHDTEEASPGYYAVTLDDDGTRVEIAATPHGAVHRITWADTSVPVLVLDLGHDLGDNEIPESWVEAELEAGEVQAYQLLQGSYSGRFGGLQTHVLMTVEPAPVSSGTWTDESDAVPGSAEVSGPGAGLWLELPSGTSEAKVRVALSYVDPEGARANHEAEVAGRSVEEVAEEAAATWTNHLSRFRVAGGTDSQRTRFHSALYHASLWPSRMDDVDGRYRGVDGEVHRTDRPYFSDLSLWDTFRTVHPWLELADPETAELMAASLAQMGADGGAIPRWPLGHGYTGGMVGSSGAQVLAGAALKGLGSSWDQEAAFALCLGHATGPMPHASRGGIEEYNELGWVSTAAGGSVSRTLEYAWSDHSLALWAEALGHHEDAELLHGLSENWANHWDPDQGFMVGRDSEGSFAVYDHPDFWNDDYVEGNAWHYLWYVPWDPAAMVELQHQGDLDAFLERHDLFWDETYAEEDDAASDSWYWHGNEPDIHYPFLGSLLGVPDHSADPIRFVLEHRYGDGPDGLDGNEDGGTLSAWYLLAATGLYPVAGTTTWAVGSPLFDRVELDRGDGTTLIIRAPGTSDAARYVQAATLGEEVLESSVIDDAELMEGLELVLELGEEPVGWGR